MWRVDLMGAFVPKPVDRFEWERLIRRLAIPAHLKYLALMVATYADLDGSRVFPGVKRLSLVMDKSPATVKRGLSDLREYGLLERVKQGNRHAKESDEYQLTVPSDASDLPMLCPDEGISGGHG